MMLLAVALGTSMLVGRAGAQPAVKPSLLIVLDSSGSMNGDDGTGRPKLAAAKDALNRVIDGLPDGAPVGLRVYGHRIPNNDKARGCADTELIVPVGPVDKGGMKAAVGGFQAKGFTPIARSLQEAAKDLPPEGDRTVVLVSDGVDTCAPPDPCQVARDLAASGVKLRIETVGFQVDAQAREQLRCIAAATGGTYVDAPDASALAGGLTSLSARAFRDYKLTGSEVRGGPNQAGAPVLAHGSYRDVIAPNQTSWYGVGLAPGQRLMVRGTLVGPPTGKSETSVVWRLALHNPSGQQQDTRGSIQAGVGTKTTTLFSGVLGQGVSGDEVGTWGVRVALEDPSRALAAASYPVELVIEIMGAPPPATAPTTVPNGVAAPPADAGGDGWSAGATLALWLACALAGATAGGIVVGRLMR